VTSGKIIILALFQTNSNSIGKSILQILPSYAGISEQLKNKDNIILLKIRSEQKSK